jgi:hypothetical protein
VTSLRQGWITASIWTADRVLPLIGISGGTKAGAESEYWTPCWGRSLVFPEERTGRVSS